MVESAWEYHSVTSYRPSDMGGGRLDWGNQPTVFKTYPGLQTVSLPEVSLLGVLPGTGGRGQVRN